MQHDKGFADYLRKRKRVPLCQRVSRRCNQHQAVCAVWQQVDLLIVVITRDDTNLRIATGHARQNVRAGVLLQVHTHLRMASKKRCQIVRQVAVNRMGIGPEPHMALNALGKGSEVRVHLLQAGKYLPGMTQEYLAGTGQLHPAGAAVQ